MPAPTSSPASSPAGDDGFEQQRDHLCGPYWAARVVREVGVCTWEGQPVDQDLMAVLAGTRLPEGAPVPSRRAGPGPRATPQGGRGSADVPRGARSDRAYRGVLATAPPARAGTAVGPLVQAIEKVATGRLRCVPVQGRWSARRLSIFMRRCHGLETGGAAPVRLLANLRSGLLWGTRPPVQLLLAAARGLEVAGPVPEWDVGHFCELAELLRGRRGQLVAVADSYPTLGFQGVHLQPLGAVAAALNRGDGRMGGVLAVVPAELEAHTVGAARGAGLDIGVWDNGSEEGDNP